MALLSLLAAAYAGSGAQAAETIPATTYFPVLPVGAADTAEPELVPLATSRFLDVIQKEVTRAVIVIHDDSRDANRALSMISALAGNENESTIILAPQFLLPSDVVRFAEFLPNGGQGFAAWQVGGWVAGDDSMPVGGRKSVSSFTVVDLIAMYLADRATFPDLKEIVVVGYGVGGNFVQRYAALTTAADVLAAQGIDVRFVAAGATSYLYHTSLRPLSGKRVGFGVPNVAACKEYNAYPFGLEKLNPYARRAGANAAKTNYALRFMIYLYAPGADGVPESNCAALLQGATEADRAAYYRIYLHTLYGDVVGKTQTFGQAKAGSDMLGLLGSACGMSALFGDGVCLPSEGGVR